MTPGEITFRPGTPADSETLFGLFLRAVADLSRRQGLLPRYDPDDPAVVAEFWSRRQSFFDHLARTAHACWVAERAGRPIGYARSVARDGILELTEFFVAPEEQSAGVGRELLWRAFPHDGFRQRTIIASTDTRAQARYVKSGVYPRFPIYYFRRAPRLFDGTLPAAMEAAPITSPAAALDALAGLDLAVLGYRRDADHAWYFSSRAGFLYYREGDLIGYGYVSTGTGSGPFALLDPTDYPAVLAHAEGVAASAGVEEFALQAPMINEVVADYVVANGFEMGSDMLLYMSDREIGRLDRYVVTSPPFFM